MKAPRGGKKVCEVKSSDSPNLHSLHVQCISQRDIIIQKIP